MLDQRPAASPVQQHRAEEAAHDEEERHPEAVDGGEDDPESGILLTIRDDPERREERQGSVQDDPQQHGDGPQGVQVGSSGKGRILDGQGRHGCEAPQSFSRFEIMSEVDKNLPLFYCSISIVQVGKKEVKRRCQRLSRTRRPLGITHLASSHRSSASGATGSQGYRAARLYLILI